MCSSIQNLENHICNNIYGLLSAPLIVHFALSSTFFCIWNEHLLLLRHFKDSFYSHFAQSLTFFCIWNGGILPWISTGSIFASAFTRREKSQGTSLHFTHTWDGWCSFLKKDGKRRTAEKVGVKYETICGGKTYLILSLSNESVISSFNSVIWFLVDSIWFMTLW